MRYLDFLSQVHTVLAPRTYLEIGVRDGSSLALSSTRSIGIDPSYRISETIVLSPEVILYEQTSDDFFAGDQPLAEFDEAVIDLGFIDGLHLYEYVLRDFMSVEKYAAPGSVVILDDVLPRAPSHATRDRGTLTWTGDVWKIIPTLREVRPDLILLLVRTRPTGLLVVLGGDVTNHDLASAYDRLLAEHVESGQEPPSEFIERSTAIYPTWVLAAPFWKVLRGQRERNVTAAQGRAELLASLEQWTSTKLDANQAKAIHPSLTGRPKPMTAAATKAVTKAAATAKPAAQQVRKVVQSSRTALSERLTGRKT